MSYFLSYSRLDGSPFAEQLRAAVHSEPRPVQLWKDTEELRGGQHWERRLDKAIAKSDGVLFVVTPDSVRDACFCSNELRRAMQYKKPIIPLLAKPVAETDAPMSIATLQWVDFTADGFQEGLRQLHAALQWQTSADGRLDACERQLAFAQRELEASRQVAARRRINRDIRQLHRECAELRRLQAAPEAADEELNRSIQEAQEHDSNLGYGVAAVRQVGVVNQPPEPVPDHFQDRCPEIARLQQFLRKETVRLIVVQGRQSMGKTTMVSRLLDAVQHGEPLVADAPEVDGVVYLGGRPQRLTGQELLMSVAKLLPEVDFARLEAIFRDSDIATSPKLRELLKALAGRRVVVLIDAAEVLLDDAGQFLDADLETLVRGLLTLRRHRVTLVMTTRRQPVALMDQRGTRQLDLDAGLPEPDAEKLLRTLDVDGSAGLKEARPDLLQRACRQTNGNPLALKALYAILDADRFTDLEALLGQTSCLPPEEAVDVFLMGEAFSRLDVDSRRVMQALAVYRWPVRAEAVDHMLRPFLVGRRSKPILDQLTSRRLVTRDGLHYRLPSAYQEHVVAGLREDQPATEAEPDRQPFTQVELARRGAGYFSKIRKPEDLYEDRQDLTAQLAEIDLWVTGHEYDRAAEVLLGIDEYLLTWGYYGEVLALHERLQGKLQDPMNEQASLGIMGNAHYDSGNLDEAKKYYQRALRVVKSIGDDELKTPFVNNLAGTHYELGDTRRALGYYEESLTTARAFSNRVEEAAALHGLGLCQTDMGNFDLARTHYRRALEIAREHRDLDLEGHLLANLGFLYALLGDEDEALGTFKTALNNARGSGDNLLVARCLSGRAEVVLDQGDLRAAAMRAEQALESNRAVESKAIMRDANCLLVMARLRGRAVKGARVAAEAACTVSFNRWAYPAFALKGITSLREDDPDSALRAFHVAVGEAEALLDGADSSFIALDALGLAQAGRVLCGEHRQLDAAAEAYRAARAIVTSDRVVDRTMRLLDDLAFIDKHGLLAELRPVAAGHS